MVYLPLIVAFSLVAFGYSQDVELQQTATTNYAYKGKKFRLKWLHNLKIS